MDSGSGLTATTTNGSKTIATDKTITPQKFFGGSNPTTVSGATQGDLYLNTVSSSEFVCSSVAGCSSGSPVWTAIGSGGGGANPGGLPTQVQYQLNGTTFGGIPGSVVGTSSVTFGPLSITTSTVSSVTPGSLLLAISSATLPGSATDYSIDTVGDSVQLGSATAAMGIFIGNVVGPYASADIHVSSIFIDVSSNGLISLNWKLWGPSVQIADSRRLLADVSRVSGSGSNSANCHNNGSRHLANHRKSYGRDDRREIFQSKALGPTAATDTNAVIPAFRVSLSTTKTYYLKYSGGFSVATPNVD